MVDARQEWLNAAHSLGLEAAVQALLPEDVKRALADQMQAFMEGGDYEAALEPGWLLVYDDPWNRDHALDFALCLQHRGELESACRFYSIALLTDPADAYCLYRMGECLQALGAFADARAAYQAAIDGAREDAAYAAAGRQAQERLDALGPLEEEP